MMFDDWKTETNRYILRHLDRKPFRALEGELEEDIAQLGDAYTAVLSENGVIDRNGDPTDTDFDEDDLLEAMLDRFLCAHPDASDEKMLTYAALVDAYLALVQEASEDL